jgi:hypothetical protein
MVIRRVNPMSAGKISGMVGVVLGLLIGACVSLIGMVAGGIASASPDMPEGGAWMGMLFGAGAIVILPIIYGVFMFVVGLVYAALFNLASKWVGGLEVETT